MHMIGFSRVWVLLHYQHMALGERGPDLMLVIIHCMCLHGVVDGLDYYVCVNV